ncbi:MAG: TonB-dependent receptor [Acidihalobacter sp.]
MGATSASVGMFYDATPKLRLRGSVSRRVRAPSINQLYDASSGNPSLQFETALNYEVGVRYRATPAAVWKATAFHMRVKNFIQKDPVTNVYANYSRYCFSGVELSGRWRPWPKLQQSASYTYLNAIDCAAGSNDPALQYRPRNKVTLQSRYGFGNGLDVHASLLYVGGEVYYSRSTPRQQAKLNAYTLVNLKLTQRLFHGRARVFVGANNIFDVNYETSYGFPQQGRFAYVGGTVKF